MNEERSFERFVANNVAGSSAGIPLPDDFYEDMHAYASHHRQRPEWLARIKEPSMRSNSQLAVGSPTMRVVAIMVATLMLAIALAAAGVAGSRLLAADTTIVVNHDGSGDYTTINEAVEAAEDGDEILIMPGEYEEAVRITRDITLRGEDRDSVVLIVADGCVTQDTGGNGVTCPDGTPTYDGYWNGVGPYGILIDHAQAHVRDLTVQTRGQRTSEQNEALPWAFTVVGGAPTIDNVLAQLTGDAGSVYVHGGSEAAVLNSELGSAVFVAEQSPVTLAGNSVKGVVMVNVDAPLSSSAEAKVLDNELKTLTFAGPVKVARNVFNGAGSVFSGTAVAFRQIGNDEYAILVDDGDGWSINENVISGSYTGGIRQPGDSGGDVVGNTVVNTGVGISVTVGTDSRLASNHVEGGNVGIQVGGAGLVEENDVSGSKNVGISISGNSTVTLVGNNSCDNGLDLRVSTSANPAIDDTNTFCDGGPDGS
jgi:hypothetical protein